MDSALRPREIQSRIRSGESLADVAKAAGVPAEKIEPYAAPVIAERGHIAGVALGASVRRRGETTAHRNLRSTIDERLTQRGIDSDTVSWDAWRLEDRRWLVQAVYRSGSATHHAQFHFDQAGRFSVAANDEARSLIGERTPGQPPHQGGSAELHDEELDELALVRAVTEQPPAEPEPAPTNVTSLRAVPRPGLTPADPQPISSPFERPRSETFAEQPPTEHSRSDPSATAASFSQQSPAEPPAIGHADAADSQPDPITGEVPDTHDTSHWPTSSKSPQEIGEQVEAEIDSYDVIPDGRSELDALYDMLGGIAEDSINIYAGLDEPPGQDRPHSGSPVEPSPSEPAPTELPPTESGRPELPAAESREVELPAAEPDAKELPPAESGPTVSEPEQPSLVEQSESLSADPAGAPEADAKPKPKPRKARKRASVPSWDEIMFGGPPTRKKDD